MQKELSGELVMHLFLDDFELAAQHRYRAAVVARTQGGAFREGFPYPQTQNELLGELVIRLLLDDSVGGELFPETQEQLPGELDLLREKSWLDLGATTPF
mmetsp:Transcript_22423/g.45756  ORF Transcript_22423/g.45756 Transcript_22423/m.45756 type:complete len:100 (+) Transcript_22423:489-788(+)